MDFLEVRKAIIHKEISPCLKAIGFKKKGNNFTFGVDTFIKVFSIENSSWNSSEFVSFSLTTGILFPRIYRIQGKEKDLQKALSARSCHFLVNTRQLCNDSELYELSKSTDIDSFTKRIRVAMKDVVGYFASLKDAHDCIGLIQKYHSSRYDIRPFVGLEMLKLGDVKNGLELIDTLDSSTYTDDFKTKIHLEKERLISGYENNK